MSHPNMYPYYYWRGPHFFRRGGSRILWFLIGAGTASFCIRRRDYDHVQWGHGHCRRVPIQESPSEPTAPNQTAGTSTNGGSSFSFRDIPRTINNLPPADWGWGERRMAEKWKEEQDQLFELRRQASEAMTDMTEATLDSILSGAEALKAKLAESRAQRKKQEELLQKQIDEQSKIPPRLI